MRDITRSVLSSYTPRLQAGADLMPAAVMLLLYERDGEEHLLFQVRSQQVEHHKGEISLPGGARDHEDESLLATALRETYEEIGVAPGHIEVFGRLDDVITRTRFVMSPFVGAITAPGVYPFRTANIEVDLLLEVPLAHLLSSESLEATVDASGRAGHAFRFGEHLIFGATARVLDGFLGLVAPDVAAERAASLR